MDQPVATGESFEVAAAPPPEMLEMGEMDLLMDMKSEKADIAFADDEIMAPKRDMAKDAKKKKSKEKPMMSKIAPAKKERAEREESRRRYHTGVCALCCCFSRVSSYDPAAEMRARVEALHQQFEEKREVLRQRRAALDLERSSLETVVALGGTVAPAAAVPLDAPVVDFSTLPTQLDERLEAEDPDGALRPTILNAGQQWRKSAQRSLLAPAQASVLDTNAQKLEKNACWDLIDALTRSGGLPVLGADLHVVVASTHCFEKSVMDTLVKDNMNPIEKLERSLLIVAESIHQVDRTAMMMEQTQ